MSENNELERALDDCLQQMSRGSSPDECLRQHPGLAPELKPLLAAATGLARGRQLSPSGAFKKRARRTLKDYWQAHPQYRHRTGPSPVALRVTAAIALAVVLLMLAGTAYAQGALPGQPLYDWKIASEKAWRAVAPDPVAVDLSIADRRADELTAVVQQPAEPGRQARKTEAIHSYQQSLQQLQSDAKAANNASDQKQITGALQSNRKKFSDAGIDPQELDQILRGVP